MPPPGKLGLKPADVELEQFETTKVDKIQWHPGKGKVYVHYQGRKYTAFLETADYSDSELRSAVVRLPTGTEGARAFRIFFKVDEVQDRRYRSPNKSRG